jgi:hypothetical protein
MVSFYSSRHHPLHKAGAFASAYHYSELTKGMSANSRQHFVKKKIQ